jgi:ABC-2 type transport system permease protein
MHVLLVNNKKAVTSLVRTGIVEIMRDFKIFFFILIFPVLFLAIFGLVSLAIPKSQELNLSMLDFMFPGILIFALVSTGFFGTSLPLIEMRKAGTMRLLKLTPLTAGEFVVSQIIVRLILAVAQIALFLVLGFLLQIIRVSDVLPLLAVSLIGMIMILNIGFFFGGFMRSVEIAGGILGALAAPLLMFSGVLLPFYILPDILEDIAYFIPFTYFGDALRQILFDNLDSQLNIYLDLLAIIGFSLLFFALTLMTFKWQNENG